MGQHVTLAKPEGAIGTAQRVFDKLGRDKDQTIAELVRLAATNKTLASNLIQRGADDLVKYLINSHNRNIYTGNSYGALRNDDATNAAQIRAQGASARHARMLLDTILPNRVRMADATRADITFAIEFYAPQAKDMTQKVTYFQAVLAGLKDNQTVGEVFDDKTLTKILENARSED